MRKFYTITLITLLALFISARGFVSYYHINYIGLFLDISHVVYADGGGDGGGDGGDGGDGDGDGGGDDGGGDGNGGDDSDGNDGPTCPIAPQDGRILVDLGTGVIVSSGAENNATKGPFPVSVPAGDYKVTLVSYDQHSIKPDQVQPDESWYLVIKNSSGGLIINTNAIGDLPQDEEYKVEEVHANLTLAQNAASVFAFHAAFPNSNANSITPLCAAFDEILVSSPIPVTVDIKINDSDGPVTVEDGNSFVHSWSSSGATTCTLISPTGTSTISLSGIGDPVGPGHPWYPSTSTPATLTIECANDTNVATDSVTVQLIDAPPTPACPLPAITGGLSSIVTINQPFSYTLTATTTGVVSTTTSFTVATSSLPNGLSYSTSTATISGVPLETGTFNITVSVVNDCGIDEKILVITVNSDDGGGNGGGGGGDGGSGGGGGGGGGGGSSRPSTTSVVTDTACFYLRDYMRRDFNNDPVEVLKLQAFLINFEGHNEVSLTGVFDQATFDAVSAFQMKYFNDILEPWGHTGPTGYVYILTLKKINEIYCQRLYPLNQAQINEIAAFRALLESLRTQETDVVVPPSIEPGGIEELDTATTTSPIIPIVGEAEPPQGQNFRNLAAAIFALPDTLWDTLQCLYGSLLILIIVYILGNVLKDVLYKNVPENTKKRFVVKWLTIDVGIALAIVAAYILEWWYPILLLLIALILSLVWTLSYSKHNSIRASIKSWYLVGSLRIKSIWKKMRVMFEEKSEKQVTKKVLADKEAVIILPPLISKKDRGERDDIKTTILDSKK